MWYCGYREYAMNNHKKIAREWARKKYQQDKKFRELKKDKSRIYRNDNKDKIREYNHKKYIERKNKNAKY